VVSVDKLKKFYLEKNKETTSWYVWYKQFSEIICRDRQITKKRVLKLLEAMTAIKRMSVLYLIFVIAAINHSRCTVKEYGKLVTSKFTWLEVPENLQQVSVLFDEKSQQLLLYFVYQ
jgi:hypothetical protein